MEISSSNKSLATNTNSPKSKKLPFFVIIFILSFSIGIIFPKTFFSQNQKQADYLLSEDQSELIVQKNLLQNPMLSFWTANLDGKVILKDKNSFTLSHIIINRSVKGRTDIQDPSDGKTLKVNYIEGKTIIKKVNEKNPNDPSTAIPISLSELEIGDIVNGNVEIKNSGSNWEIIGQGFFVQI